MADIIIYFLLSAVTVFVSFLHAVYESSRRYSRRLTMKVLLLTMYVMALSDYVYGITILSLLFALSQIVIYVLVFFPTRNILAGDHFFYLPGRSIFKRNPVKFFILGMILVVVFTILFICYVK